jgi:hypothetical protein
VRFPELPLPLLLRGCFSSLWGVSPLAWYLFVAGVLPGLRFPRGVYVVPALPVCVVRQCSFVVNLDVLLVCLLSWVHLAPFNSRVFFLSRVGLGVEFRVGDTIAVAGVGTRVR